MSQTFLALKNEILYQNHISFIHIFFINSCHLFAVFPFKLHRIIRFYIYQTKHSFPFPSNHWSLFSCIHSLTLSNFSLVQSLSAEFHVTISALFLSSRITSGVDPDYIHSSHVCSGKVIKKYRNSRFLLQIILFFFSADRKD